MKLHSLVPSARRAIALGIGLAVIPATVALASTGGSASANKSASFNAPLSDMYPFNSDCSLLSGTTTRTATASGGVTFALNPRVSCNHIKTRIHVGADLWHNGSPTQLYTAANCRIGIQVPNCQYLAAQKRAMTVSSTGKKGVWFTRVNFSVQGPDALFVAQKHPRDCKFESQSTTAFCKYSVDQVTL